MRNLLRLRASGAGRLRWRLLVPALVAVLVAGGLALGNGIASHTVSSGYDMAWLPDDTSGQVVQVDPVSGTANTRMQVAAPGHPLQIEQGDGHLVIVDKRTGKITTIDVSTLLVGGSRAGAAGGAAQVLLDGAHMYVANLTAGTVQAVDPATETNIGTAWHAGHQLIDIGLDGEHNVWALDSTSRLVALDWSATRRTLVAQSTHSVADAGPGSVIVGHDQGVTVVGGKGAVVRVGTGKDTKLSAPSVTGPLSAPQSSPSDLVPVAVPTKSSVLIVGKKGVVLDNVAPLGCGRPGTPAAFHGKVYVPCDGAHKVIVLGRDGKQAGPAVPTKGSADAQLVIGAGRLLINVPGSGTVSVIDGSGSTVQVPTGSPNTGVHNPTSPPPTPPPPPPVTTPPATSAHDNGGGSDSHRGGAPDGHRPTGPRNNGKHDGHRGGPATTPATTATTPAAGPTTAATAPGSAPPPPSGSGTAQAEAQDDGTVLIRWNGDGAAHATGYVVEMAGTDGTTVAQAPAGSTSATVTVLDPGTTARFVVHAMAGEHELWSATTGIVTSFARPGGVTGVSVSAAKVSGGKAALSVSWNAAAAHGATVVYSVSAAGGDKPVTTGSTATQLTVPCASGCSGTVTVSPANAAGTGTPGKASYEVTDRTLPPPNSDPPPQDPPPTKGTTSPPANTPPPAKKTTPAPTPTPDPPAGGAMFVSVTGSPTNGNTGGPNPHPATVTLQLTPPGSWATWVDKADASCELTDNGQNAQDVSCTAAATKTMTYLGSGTHEYQVVATGSNGTVSSKKDSAEVTVYHTPPCPYSAGATRIAGSGPLHALPMCDPPCEPGQRICPRPRSAGQSALPPATLEELAWLALDIARGSVA